MKTKLGKSKPPVRKKKKKKRKEPACFFLFLATADYFCIKYYYDPQFLYPFLIAHDIFPMQNPKNIKEKKSIVQKHIRTGCSTF